MFGPWQAALIDTVDDDDDDDGDDDDDDDDDCSSKSESWQPNKARAPLSRKVSNQHLFFCFSCQSFVTACHVDKMMILTQEPKLFPAADW